jgi:hypothetical protein
VGQTIVFCGLPGCVSSRFGGKNRRAVQRNKAASTDFLGGAAAWE